MLELMAVRDKF